MNLPRFFGSIRTLVAGLVLLYFAMPGALLNGQTLETIRGVEYVPAKWADGDSFRVRFPNGKEHTIRLYGADCLEWHISNETDARRLRAQRRYFGISDYGGDAQASIDLARAQGKAATDFVREVLATPFTVHTSFADGRGDPRHKRIYAFVETSSGEDLATLLVRQGLARAFGVYRSTADGLSRNDYIEQLKDAELVAARKGVGVWQVTDWDALMAERRAQRQDEAEERMAMGTQPPSSPLDLNSASLDELVTIPGIGEATANRIIEARPFGSVEDLTSVSGIGAASLERFRPYLKVE